MLLVIVGAAGKAEVGASVYHVEVERYIILEVRFRLACYLGCTHLRERFRPVGEPSGVELGYHVRAFAVMVLVYHFFQVGYVALAVCGGQGAFGAASLKQPTAIRGEQRHIESCIGQLLLYFSVVGAVFFQGNILALCHVGAKFVFALHHDDGAALGTLQVAYLLVQAVNVRFGMFQELGIVPSYLHAWHVLQPPGVAAKFPFGTHVWAGAQNHHHAFFSGYLDVFGQVLVAGKVPFAGFGFVGVPKYVGGYGVQSHSLHHLQAVAPVLVGDAGIVHLARKDGGYFTVAVEMSVFYLEGGF